MLAFQKKKSFTEQELAKNILCKFSTVLVTGVYTEDIAKIICQIFNIIFNNIMMKIMDIYVSTAGYLFQWIFIHIYSMNNQYFMLYRPVLHDITIDAYKQEISPTWLLTDGVNTICLLI